MKTYSGIGSRTTPDDVLSLMKSYARKLALAGYVLRSGGADGADKACEEGCDEVNGKKEIYLPWKKFNKNASPLFGVCEEALKLAASLHPAWEACSDGAKRLHSRNCYQVLSHSLDCPSDFVLCWTPSEQHGGTSLGIRLARQHNIPVYNLHEEERRKAFEEEIISKL